MSYTSKNTKVLATFDQGRNTRMMLLHTFENGRMEYVIGSYFTTETNVGDPYDMNGPAFIDSYSWDWGHYFSDIVAAVDYWKREVLGIDDHKPERFICPDCSGVYQEHPVELDYEDGCWSCPECGCSTFAPEEDLCIRIDYME